MVSEPEVNIGKAVVGQAATVPCENVIKLTGERNIEHAHL